MLRWRILSSLVGAPIVLVMIYLGRYAVGALVLVLAVTAMIEFYTPWPNKNIFPATLLGVFFGGLFPILATLMRTQYYLPVLLVGTISIVLWQMFSARKTRIGIDAGVTLLGLIYAGLMPSYLILIRGKANGFLLLLAVVLAVWAADIAGYSVGTLLGKRKLAPAISPNKTIEGAVAGVVAALAVAGGFAVWGGLSVPKAVAIGLLVGILSQAGDLFASMVKREVGIKDFGRFIPGHGGVLDRFDGLFFIAPLIFYMLSLY